MNRFAVLALVFAVLTLVLGYQAFVAVIQGAGALAGFRAHSIRGPAVLRLGQGVLCLYLAWLTSRLARQHVVLSRLTQKG